MSNAQQSAGADDESIGYIRIVPNGFVTPGIQSHLRGGTAIVRENGLLEIEELETIDLRLKDRDAIPEGTEVRLRRSMGEEYCIPVEEYEREQYQKKADAYLKARKKRKKRREKREAAEAFWAQYEIPFEYEVGIKGRRSGLTRGSAGNARYSGTVEHLYVEEAFEDGRLSRDAETFLCTPGASWPFPDERRRDENNEEYLPPVTCDTCLKRMERWRVADDSRGNADE